MPDWNKEGPDPDSNDPRPTSKRTYGNLMKFAWVLGLYKSTKEVRFVVIEDRKASNLLPVIHEHVTEGSVVVTDDDQVISD